MRVIAYTYEADVHCVDCTKDRARRGGFNPHGIDLVDQDEHGVPYDGEDDEGNGIHPVFSTDEGFENSACGTCREPIEELSL